MGENTKKVLEGAQLGTRSQNLGYLKKNKKVNYLLDNLVI